MNQALLKEIKHIIWDWNGTLIDDIQLTIDLVNEVLVDCEMPLVDREQYQRVFKHPVRMIYEDLGVDLNKYSFKRIGQQFHDGYYQRYHQYDLQEGAREILDYCHRTGFSQSLLSAFPQRDLVKIVSSKGIASFFDEITGQDNNYAVGKTETAKHFISDRKLQPGEVLLIGDTKHDAEVADAIGASCLLVSIGYQHPEILHNLGKPVFDSLAAVQDYLCSARDADEQL